MYTSGCHWYSITPLKSTKDEPGLVKGKTQMALDNRESNGGLALKKAQAFSAALLNAIDTLIFIVDADSTILRVNQACQTLGYSRGELKGVLFYNLISSLERRNEIRSSFTSFFESNRSEFYQDQLISKQGELRWVRWRVVPIRANNKLISNEEPSKLVISGHDVTDEVLRNQLAQESDARFQAMAANINNVLFIGDINSTSIQYVSPVYEHMFGLSCESLLADASSFLSVVHPQDLEHVKTAFQQGPSYRSISGEYRILKIDNEIRWVRYKTFPVFDANNTPSQIIGMIEDITKEKQAYNTLHYQMQLASCVAELARQLTSATSSTIDEIINDCLARIGECTQADRCYLFDIQQPTETVSCTYEWCAAGVRPQKDSLQKLPFNLLSFGMQYYHSGTVLNIPDTLVCPEVSDLEKEIIQRMGIRSILSVPINTDDFCVGFAKIHGTRSWKQEKVVQFQLLADVIANTRRRIRAELEVRHHAAHLEEHIALRTQELANANKQLSRANRLKDEFLANISHELRTPLNAILLKVELMKEGIQGPLTKQQRHSLDIVQESSNHLLTMLADMLDLSTSASEMLSLNLSLTSLQKICESSMTGIRKAADKNKVRMIYKRPQTDIFVHVDTERIKQILDHLLSNAVKFTPSGGDIGIDIAIDQQSDVLQLTVWDTGRGILEEDLPLLFHPFVQLEGGLDRRFEGPGIGLALVKRLVFLHRGEISVKSQIGKGSRFIITLPYRLDQKTDPTSEKTLYEQQY